MVFSHSLSEYCYSTMSANCDNTNYTQDSMPTAKIKMWTQILFNMSKFPFTEDFGCKGAGFGFSQSLQGSLDSLGKLISATI